MKEFMEKYGNAAVIAWNNELAWGHMIYVPKKAERWKMQYHERMPQASYDSKTLIIQATGFCSIYGHEYRHRGMGSKK